MPTLPPARPEPNAPSRASAARLCAENDRRWEAAVTRTIDHWKDEDWWVMKYFPHDPWLEHELQTLNAQLLRLCFTRTEARLADVPFQRHMYQDQPGWVLLGTTHLYFNLEAVHLRWRTPSWPTLLRQALGGFKQHRELRPQDAEALTRHVQAYLDAFLDAVVDSQGVHSPADRHRLATDIAQATLQPRPPLRA